MTGSIDVVVLNDRGINQTISVPHKSEGNNKHTTSDFSLDWIRKAKFPSILSTKDHNIEVLKSGAIIFARGVALLSTESVNWKRLYFAQFGYIVDPFFCTAGIVITSSTLSTIPKSENLAKLMDIAIPFCKKGDCYLISSAFHWRFVLLLISSGLAGKGQIIPVELMSKFASHVLTQT